MKFKGLFEEEALLVSPEIFRKYVEERGWKRVQHVKGDLATYRRPGSLDYEIMILNTSKDKYYGRRTIESINELAQFEKREPESVLQELMELSTLSEAEYQEVEPLHHSDGSDITEKENNAPSPTKNHTTNPSISDDPER